MGGEPIVADPLSRQRHSRPPESRPAAPLSSPRPKKLDDADGVKAHRESLITDDFEF